MTISVVELFAGVGGFRLGLEASSERYKTVWANQWEPGRMTQHAFDCYAMQFGDNHNCVNENISIVKKQVPNHDLLVGGFPCQDYSVARTGATGIEGKKGVLWWDIKDIVSKKKPKYVLLENVDRILKSPANQRGRDFGVMLRCLNDLGYGIEWRVINAADYGYPQRRRRTFIFAFHKSTSHYKRLVKSKGLDILLHKGMFASEFDVKQMEIKGKGFRSYELGKDTHESLVDVSNEFNAQFFNAGVCFKGKISTMEVAPIDCDYQSLADICLQEKVDEKYFLNGSLDKWEYLKGAKKAPRVKPNGEPYFYTEGAMAFPDHLHLPARTILTSESSVNRSTHVIKDFKTGKLRLLTPMECERLNGFPDDWTNTGMPEKFRYFTMGNALVVPIIERIGSRLLSYIEVEEAKEEKVLVSA